MVQNSIFINSICSKDNEIVVTKRLTRFLVARLFATASGAIPALGLAAAVLVLAGVVRVAFRTAGVSAHVSRFERHARRLPSPSARSSASDVMSTVLSLTSKIN